MSVRLVELSAAIRDLVPHEIALVFVVITAFGSPTILTVALSVLYWVDSRREEVAAVVGYGFVAFAAVVALKAWFALPRPPEALWLTPTEGYGFPSGHATAAVVIYGGLSLELELVKDYRRAAGVAVIVGLIAISRVVIGVHYLGDVLAGLALGTAVLLGSRLLARGDPAFAFGLGALAALPAIALTGGGETAVGILGACLGGVVGSRTIAVLPDVPRRRQAAVLLAVGLPMVVVLVLLGEFLVDLWIVQALVQTALVLLVLALPLGLARTGAFERIRGEDGAREAADG